jgi:hypothetical protein
MDDEKLKEETLFLAVTRPTMWLGVPIEASLPIALAACLTLIVTGNPLYAFASRGLSRHSPADRAARRKRLPPLVALDNDKGTLPQQGMVGR